MRRHFALPEMDEDYLAALGLAWEAVKENNIMRIIIYDFPVSPGYTIEKVALNIRIEGGYPDVQIDMVYFYPHLSLLNGRKIQALADDPFDEKIWQRWSRHRTDLNPWRSGIDCVASHVHLIQCWLEKELTRS